MIPLSRANSLSPSRADGEVTPRARIVVVGVAGMLGVVLWAGYHNSFSVPFFFDDNASIVNNPAIRSVDLGALFNSPPHAGVAGRPLLGLSFAFNFAFGGLSVGGYHAFNWLIHFLAAITLLGVVRRTLLLPEMRVRFGRAALPLAAAVAGLWALHPLQTESVTYVSQRAESLMGLFYLLTVYCFVRGADSPVAKRWWVLTVGACAAGMATKEIMVTAPFVVLLFDRSFVAGSFRAAWTQRRPLYLGLAATWLLLACLMWSSSLANRGVGFASGMSSWEYALTECKAVWWYLGLAVWPHPLVVDYGMNVMPAAREAVVYALSCGALVVGAFVALWKWPTAGFVGAWFFVVLSPTSSVVPVAFQPIAEHRMYVPLAGLVTGLVVGGWRRFGWKVFPVLGVVAAIFTVLTERRNRDFESEETIWRDTLAKVPGNARIQNTLACVLVRTDRAQEAEQHFKAALAIGTDDPEFLRDYAGGLCALGRPAEALPLAERAVRQRPGDPVALNSLGNALAQLGRASEAIPPIARALELRPIFPEARRNLGFALGETGRLAEAQQQLEEALRLDPDSAATQNELGRVLCKAGRVEEGIKALEHALRLKPAFGEALCNLGNGLFLRGQVPVAIERYRDALRLKPGLAEAHCNLGLALAEIGQLDEGAARCAEALRLKPSYPDALNNLGIIRLKQGRVMEAVENFNAAVTLKPGYAEAHNAYGVALIRANRAAEAIDQFEAALRSRPDYPQARDNLVRLRAMLQAQTPPK